MRKTLFLLTLLLTLLVLSSPAWAQATGSIGASFTATEQRNNDQVGINFGAGYRAPVGQFSGNAFAEGFARDGFGTRSRFGAALGYKYQDFMIWGGAGYFCNGRCRGRNDGAFAQLGLDYSRFHGFGRIGANQMLEAEAAVDVANFGEHLGVQVFGRGTRLLVGRNRTQTVYPIGLRLTFK